MTSFCSYWKILANSLPKTVLPPIRLIPASPLLIMRSSARCDRRETLPIIFVFDHVQQEGKQTGRDVQKRAEKKARKAARAEKRRVQRRTPLKVGLWLLHCAYLFLTVTL